MKFNREILTQNGWGDWNDEELINFLNNKIYYLLTHNKNYTNKQYILIDQINEILQAITL